MPNANNPLLQAWTHPYGLPPFSDIKPEHFEPAFEVAMREQLAEIDAIAAEAAPATFANTVEALDRGGRLLARISKVFGNLTSSETSPALQAVERAMAPRLAAHRNAIYMHAGLFDRIAAVHARRDSLGLQDEDLALLERVHFDFVLSGAKLPPESRSRYAEITQELAQLTTRFAQNLLAEESSWALQLNGEADLAGLPDSVRSAARTAALERGLGAEAYAITLSPSLAEPFLTFSSRRDLREIVWRARVARGAHEGEHDNRPVAAGIVALRQELAGLHGYASYADYALADRMAQDTAAVLDLLRKAWEPAKAKAADDRALLTATAKRLGEPTPIAAWDWRYVAEKVRQQQFDLDDAALKPYFTLDNMIAAMFDCAGRLFGLRFVEQASPGLYHPDVRLWEVRGRDNALVGIFLGDNYARASKRSGAWMSVFRSQSGIDGGTLPIVINNNNFAKASPTLLSFDDVRTLFHEFGHALHGLLSQVRHERLSGTSVLRDFVELPSQLFENWALEPQILQQHARHWQTGEPIPNNLIDKLLRARRFDQAWATIQYTGPALIDMALHSLPNGTPVDIAEFEAQQCKLLGVPEDIGLRHHLTHFGHLFAGGYAAGYYVYMWAEVLEADAFDAFAESGDPFHPETAQRLHLHIYSTGGKSKPAHAYRAFRGRDAMVEAMLKKRGLVGHT
ncbi:M3 family metallopeptidase [Caenimonas soli]|uniref:M3 family metallopeptidase n=1 Tax=Caenimonas soli TaxID=2735555 RepID=UPI0015544D66|nr:M3 family metallopeptidase [Caenimonas soli]NPC54582.1 M3 family metallopeptidase [Caenimonas soli]